jgi:hypothetical protein
MSPKAISAAAFQHWNTPEDVLAPLRGFLPITLDPCSNPFSTVGAQVSVELPGDGLALSWARYGHTFVNPPYEDVAPWLCKAAVERVLYDAVAVTMLIPAAVETVAFRDFVFAYADAIAFWNRRIGFVRSDGGKVSGNAHASALVYYGAEPARFADHFAPYATVATEWSPRS